MSFDATGNQNRRDFIKTGTLAAAGTLAGIGIISNAWSQNADPIKLGLVGCGGRGTGAVDNAINSSPNVKLVAMGDLFQDELDKSYKNLSDPNRERGPLPGIEVDKEHMFTGFDAFKKVIDSDIDYVILATPPHFRAEHFEYAISKGRHVFTEKPVAVDPFGIKRFMAAGKVAEQKGLCVVAGTQRRHDPGYNELMDRVHNGEIGDIIHGRAFWNMGGLWKHERQSGYSDMEWMIRNWLYFCWVSGDHIVEQHVHNIDVINWAVGAHPLKAIGAGGRQVRTAPVYGNIYDHFVIDFEYENGTHMTSMCRQWEGTDGLVAEFLSGSKGSAETDSKRQIIRAEKNWRYKATPPVDPYVQEHTDLIAAIRSGNKINEAQQVAESCMTAIMGRTACYTGNTVTWDEMMASDLRLGPTTYAMGPVEIGPVPIPGQKV